MRIEDDAKRKHYHGFIGRQGYGFKRQYAQRKLPRSAIGHMSHKPYGGIYEQKLDTHGQC